MSLQPCLKSEDGELLLTSLVYSPTLWGQGQDTTINSCIWAIETLDEMPLDRVAQTYKSQLLGRLRHGIQNSRTA